MLIHGFDLLSLHQSLIEIGLCRLINMEPHASISDVFLKLDELMLVCIQLHLLLSLSEGRNELTACSTHVFYKIIN